jgi:3-phenylpropionate/trans-cinnamate dioxygenase ferredoxin reductase subunit
MVDNAAGMVIVGAGECGARAAVTLRESGYSGTVTLIGEETHLPYERPPLSKDAITSSEPSSKVILDDARLSELRIDYLSGRKVVSIEAEKKIVMFDDGSKLAFEKLLIATGATPRRLPHLPASDQVFYLRTFSDAMGLRNKLSLSRKVAVIGGGFIGLEVAATARRLGADVVVLETNNRLMKRGVPEEIADVVLKRHRDNGVEVRLDVSLDAITCHSGGVDIRFADGASELFDMVVVGIGAQPVTELAGSAGIELENGIAVDAKLRTSKADIFAAGDCCSFPHALFDGRRVRFEAWRNAQDQGAAAARNMLGADEDYDAVPWMWSDQFDLTLMIAGMPDEGVIQVRRDIGNGAFLLFHLTAEGRLVGVSGVGVGNAVARDIRLAEMLIARRAHPAVERLASDEFKLKALLAEAA